MFKTLVLITALATSLTACGGRGFDRLSYSVDVDGEKGVALFTCKESSSGRCIFRFDGNAQPTTTTLALDETGAVTGVGPGTGYCATTGASGATCHGQALQAGRQAIRHQKRSRF